MAAREKAMGQSLEMPGISQVPSGFVKIAIENGHL